MAYRVAGGPATPVVIVGTMDIPAGVQSSSGVPTTASSVVLTRSDFKTAGVVIEAGTAFSVPPVDMREWFGGQLLVPIGWDAANIGFYVGEDANGSFVPLLDDTGVPVQISGVVVGTASVYQLPYAIFGSFFIKLWSKSTVLATKTNVNQADNVILQFYLKS